jgi:hypothetical protein
MLLIGGRAYPHKPLGENPLTARGFTLCDGQPCFLGIVMGVSRFDEAQTTIDKVFTNPFRRPVMHAVDNIVQKIELVQQENFLFGDFILLYGTPCRVWIDVEYEMRIHIYYPHLSLTTVEHTSRVGLLKTIKFTTKISEISLLTKDLCGEKRATHEVDWMGFTYLGCYIDKERAVRLQQEIDALKPRASTPPARCENHR